jgi:hypothetical protein
MGKAVWTPDLGWTDDGPEVRVGLDGRGRLAITPSANEKLECGFCGGRAVKADIGYVHAEDGDRVKVGGPGDFVSAGHNRAGTRINPVDLIDADDDL